MGAAGGELTIELLAERTGETKVRLRRWEACGLIAGAGDHSGADSFERARLIRFADRRGIAPEAIADAAAEQGDVLARHLELAAAAPAHATSSWQR